MRVRSRLWAPLILAVLVACQAPQPLRKPAALWDETRLCAMLQLADEQMRTGKFDQARGTLAAFHASGDPRLASALARVDVEEGHYDAALRRLEAVPTAAHSGALYHRLHGVALEGLGHWDAAATAYEAAYQAEPSMELLLAWLDALVLDGRAPAAQELLTRERDRFPGQPVLQVLAARLYARDGSFEAALHELATASIAEPQSAEIRQRLAETLTASGRYADAVPIWRALLRTKPDDDAVRLGLATATLAAGDPAAALEVTLCVLEHNQDPDARLLAALCYRRLGQPDKAAELLSDLHADESTARLAERLLASCK